MILLTIGYSNVSLRPFIYRTSIFISKSLSEFTASTVPGVSKSVCLYEVLSTTVFHV